MDPVYLELFLNRYEVALWLLLGVGAGVAGWLAEKLVLSVYHYRYMTLSLITRK